MSEMAIKVCVEAQKGKENEALAHIETGGMEG